jgi:maltooligosyltrehalose synthase
MVTIVDERKLETYLGFHHNQFLYQKAGYILSYFPKMKLSKSFFKRCHSHIGKSIRYLSMDNRWENPIYHAFWFHHNQFLYTLFSKMKLSKSFFKRCHSHIGKSIRYLSMDNRWENPIYHAFWQLYAPEDLLKTMEQGANADV